MMPLGTRTPSIAAALATRRSAMSTPRERMPMKTRSADALVALEDLVRDAGERALHSLRVEHHSLRRPPW